MELKEFKSKLNILPEGVFLEEEFQLDDIGELLNMLKESMEEAPAVFDEELDHTSILSAITPEGLDLPPFEKLIFSNIAFIRATEEKETQLYFTINWPGEWEIFEDYFAIEEIEINLAIQGTEVEAILFGVVNFRGYELKATVELPTLFLELELLNPFPNAKRPSPFVLLKHQIQSEEDELKELAIDPPGISNKDTTIKLSQLHISAYPSNQEFAMAFGMLNIPIYKSLSLDFEVRLAYFNIYVSGAFRTAFQFDGKEGAPGFSIPVQAAFDNSNSFLRFEGGISLSEYSVPDVVQMIATKFDKQIVLPPFSREKEKTLRLNYLALGFEKNESAYSFDFVMELSDVFDFTPQGVSLFSIEKLFLFLSYEHSEEDSSFEGEIRCNLIIANTSLEASASKDQSGWHFTAKGESLQLGDWLNGFLKAGTGIGLPAGITEFELSEANISYHTDKNYFSVGGNSSGGFSIPIGNSNKQFTLSGLDFNFQKEEAVNVKFSGRAAVENKTKNKVNPFQGIDFSVEMEYISTHKNIEEAEAERAGHESANEAAEIKPSTWKIEARSKNSISIGEIINSFGLKDVKLPDSLGEETSLSNLFIKVETSEKTFEIGGTCDFQLDGTQKEYDGKIDLSLKVKGTEVEVHGVLTMTKKTAFSLAPPHVFGLHFIKEKDGEKEKGDQFIVAQYQGGLSLSSVVEIFDPNAAKAIPAWLNPSMEETLFLIHGKKELLLAIQLDLTTGDGINLKNIEFVGQFIPEDKSKVSLSIDFFFASQAISKEEVEKLNKKLKGLGSKLSLPKEDIDNGLTVTPHITADLFGEGLKLPKRKNPIPEEGTDGVSPTQDQEKTSWKAVRKKLGPVFIDKVGLTMEDGKVKILLDAGMEISGFTFKLLDFGIKIPLRPNIDAIKDIDFGLNGLELNLTKGDVQISGGFYKQTLAIYNQATNTEKNYNGYVGEIKVAIGPKSLSAFGGYVLLDPTPSFFLYAVATLPLGGSAEFFIDGFAGGFGINSSVVIPKIEKVRNFIMVKSAFGEPYMEGDDVSSNLSKAFETFKPTPGQYWVAIGIKANHYKFVESFLLAIITFGERLEIDILGRAKLKMPKGAEKLAKAELDIIARFVPAEGIFKVDGRISDGSYILNPMAKISGGFAFYTWFKGEHAGDFVITLGGYSPGFKKPDHYPAPSRLTLDYRISDSLFVKATAYFALTPLFFMAGGKLEGVFETDWVEARLEVQAHFRMNFQPFQYTINAGISIEGRVFVLLGWASFHVGTSISLWGPDFGGKAVIDLCFTDFTIRFGKPLQLPAPISWNSFREEFLPEDRDIAKIFIADGLVKELKGDEYTADHPHYIVNPNDLKIRVESAIPVKKGVLTFLGTKEPELVEVTDCEIGIGPMNLPAASFSSEFHLTFTQFEKDGEGIWKAVRGNQQDDDLPTPDEASSTFYFEPIRKPVPAGLWGKFMDRDLDSESLLGKNNPEEQPITGFTFKPNGKPPKDFYSADLTDLKEQDTDTLEPFVPNTPYRDPVEDGNSRYFIDCISGINKRLVNSLEKLVILDEDGKEEKLFGHLPKFNDLSFISTKKSDREKSILQLNQFEDPPVIMAIGSDEGELASEKEKCFELTGLYEKI